MGQYMNNAVGVDDPKKGLNYLGRNVGAGNDATPQKTVSLDDLKGGFGDLSKTGAIDFAKGLFGGNNGYADTIAKWGNLSSMMGNAAAAGGGGAAGALGALA